MPSFSQAYTDAKISPVAYMLHGVKMGLNFNEIYPEVDEPTHAIIKALATPTEMLNTVMNNVAVATGDLKVASDAWPKNTPKFMRKMTSQNWWGDHAVSITGLRSTLLRKIDNLDEIVDWALDHGMIAYTNQKRGGPGDAIALVPNAKKEIEAIAAVGVV